MTKSSEPVVLLLSAGLGKRLQPFTLNTPKPLLTIGGKTLLERNLEMVARSGLSNVYINLFHLGDQIEHFVGNGDRWGLHVQFARERELLDTGGGIRNVFHLSGAEELVVINSDILVGPEFSLQEVVQAHRNHQVRPFATLVLRGDVAAADYGSIGVSQSGRIARFLDAEAPEADISEILMFTGVHVIESKSLTYMPPVGVPFSITRDTYRSLVRDNKHLHSVRYHGYWSDVGTPDRVLEASKATERIFSVPKN